MAVLLLAEVNGTELAVDATAKAGRAATALGDVTILCASAGCGPAASAAARASDSSLKIRGSGGPSGRHPCGSSGSQRKRAKPTPPSSR